MTSTAWRLICTGVVFALFASGSYLVAQATPQVVGPAATVQPAVTVAGQSSARQIESSNAIEPESRSIGPQDIVIGPGDLLEIRVFGVQDLTQEVRVSSSGAITVPLVGTAHVADLTQKQAEDFLAAKFREGGFLNDPHVSVFTKEYATQGVSVLGEVSKPGVYALLGARRLFDVISMAGGLTDRAGKLVAISHRDDPTTITNVEISNDPAKSGEGNVPISPGDTVVISKAGIVYVVGDVTHPAGFVMSNNERLTVLQAVALAGGTNSTASLDSAKVIRKTAKGIQEIPMPLKKILSAKAEDVPLQAEDVLFIPRSAAKSAARRSAESILQITTGIAIYRR